MTALNGPSPRDSGDAHSSVRSIRQYVKLPSATVRQLAFWLAVILPFLYLPLLISGAGSAAERTVLVSLMSVNVVALYIGHDHDPAQ